MKGSPWLKMFLVAVGFIAAGYPVWSLTHRPATIQTAAVLSSPETEQLSVQLTFSKAPATFTLSYLNQTLLQQISKQTSYSLAWKAALPPEGIDLLLKVGSDGKTAVRIEIDRGQETLVDKTFWTEKDLVELVTIPGKKP